MHAVTVVEAALEDLRQLEPQLLVPSARILQAGPIPRMMGMINIKIGTSRDVPKFLEEAMIVTMVDTMMDTTMIITRMDTIIITIMDPMMGSLNPP
jgi:hypothetical protein